MKKTKSVNLPLLLLSVFLLFIIAGSIGYSVAYFTSRDSKNGNIYFHDIDLEVSSLNDGNSIFDKTLTSVLPGDTLSFDAISITNTGSAPVYAILKLKIVFKDSSGVETEDSFTKWYNLTSTTTEINTSNLLGNTVGATELAAGDSKTLSLSYNLSGETFGDEYKNGQIQVVLSAYCIQKDNLETIEGIQDKSLIATYMLVTDYNQ